MLLIVQCFYNVIVLIDNMKAKQPVTECLYESNLNIPITNNESFGRLTGDKFYYKTFGIIFLQLLIIWIMNCIILFISPLSSWLQTHDWFIWMFFFSGLFIDLEMMLIPQVQFITPFNYILMAINSMIISFPASRSFCGLETFSLTTFAWMLISWTVTLALTLMILMFGKLIRFNITISLRIFFTSVTSLQVLVSMIILLLKSYIQIDMQFIISGSGMLLTILYELLIATQAIFPGDKRFTFQDNQHFLCGLILGTIMISINMIISSEITFVFSFLKHKNSTNLNKTDIHVNDIYISVLID
ncbi:unnamed protein product [Schistosoma turkestanicum]|nr:unnamed protein product [Schistosoma turkestanicum]